MAGVNELVMQAVLALTATYILDFAPSESVQDRANTCHKRAAQLYNEETLNEDILM
jgi:hypothetical protein